MGCDVRMDYITFFIGEKMRTMHCRSNLKRLISSFLCFPQGLGLLERFVSNFSLTIFCLSFEAFRFLPLHFFCGSFMHPTSKTLHTVSSFYQLLPFNSLSFWRNCVIFIEILLQPVLKYVTEVRNGIQN